MNGMMEHYKKIYGRIQKEKAVLIDLEKSFEYKKQQCIIQISDVTNSLEDEVRMLDEKESKIKAFISIAETHTRNLVESSTPIVWDSGKLSRLAVQINNITNDVYAAQLYKEATGQLKYVQHQRVVVESKKISQWKELNSMLDYDKRTMENAIRDVEMKLSDFIQSDTFLEFTKRIAKDNSIYNSCCESGVACGELGGGISIGTALVPFSIPQNLRSIVNEKLYISPEDLIRIPIQLSIQDGMVVVANYDNQSEETILSGVQNFLLNVARYYGDEFTRIHYVDPIRYNASGLGSLAAISGANSFIDTVPTSVEDIRNKMASIITEIGISEKYNGGHGIAQSKKTVYVFHNFPHGYDSNTVKQIQQLCVNASNYKSIVILTNNQSSKKMDSSDVMEYIRSFALQIGVNSYYDYEMNKEFSFEWYNAPSSMPSDIQRRYIDEKPAFNLDTNYNNRIGVAQDVTYRKGIRRLENIPYGVNENGVIQYLSFEDSNFATFICGAARSGKSTLLHTIITGLIKNNHPDDIELWLIDFKMTEFSRYIEHLPPHVRYILLDESPELVYDIIDRLTEILIKRQNMYKGKWQKLSDVPKDKYMPAIMVIIDEFSVMSQILAESVTLSDNYIVKLQMLLAKGAALGLHFIFASQGFTSGTRGLNDFSKKQVQQRIAMKTEYNEIKETLDLKSLSDGDKYMMEQLPVHHAITRIPMDERGNHLKLSQVLYISDYSEQENMIYALNDKMQVVSRYDAYDNNSYISKQPLIVDGNKYMSYLSMQGQMLQYIESNSSVIHEEEEAILFIGEPRRMRAISPIHIVNEFGENILIIAPAGEKMTATSVVLSIVMSLDLQNQMLEVWSSKKSVIYKQIRESGHKIHTVRIDLEDICRQIKYIKKQIQNKQYTNKYYVLLGFESILTDFSYHINTTTQSTMVMYERRNPGELDLLSRMNLGIDHVDESYPAKENGNEYENNDWSDVYDAREDLKYILTNGPRMGYHFVMQFGTVGEFLQYKLDTTLYKHKIMFRTAKNDAGQIVGKEANNVAGLYDYTFRYCNGLESMSYRPYLHVGLSWDGWKMTMDGIFSDVDEEEEYLL